MKKVKKRCQISRKKCGDSQKVSRPDHAPIWKPCDPCPGYAWYMEGKKNKAAGSAETLQRRAERVHASAAL